MEEGVFYIPLFVRCGTDSYSHIIASGGVIFRLNPKHKIDIPHFPFFISKNLVLDENGTAVSTDKWFVPSIVSELI